MFPWFSELIPSYVCLSLGLDCCQLLVNLTRRGCPANLVVFLIDLEKKIMTFSDDTRRINYLWSSDWFGTMSKVLAIRKLHMNRGRHEEIKNVEMSIGEVSKREREKRTRQMRIRVINVKVNSLKYADSFPVDRNWCGTNWALLRVDCFHNGFVWIESWKWN